MKKNPQTKARQKITRTRENKISPKTKGMGTCRITIFVLFTLIVERKLHKASHGNERAFHVREVQQMTRKKETIVIRGIVKNKEGTPLPGVTILIKGSTVGVSHGH